MSSNGSGGGPVTLSDVEKRIGFTERLLDGLSPNDELLTAILQNQVYQLEGQAGRAPFADGPVSEGVLRDAERGMLPENALGVLAEDINSGALGDAVFRLQGSTFVSQVKNDDPDEVDLQAGEAVEVMESETNNVRAAGAAASVSGLFSEQSADTFRFRGQLRTVPRVIDADQDVKVANQVYDKGDYNSVQGGLGPGESKTVAQITVERDQFILLRSTNATAHDTVEYEYYIDQSPDQTGAEPDPDLSGAQPWATPPELYNVVPDGYQLVESNVSLVLNETSGNTSYSTVQGTLTGLVLQV